MERLTEFAPAGANQAKSVFCRDMCVAKNTSRSANVRSALQQTASFCRKRLRLFRQVV